MSQTLRLLLVEDSEIDAELLLRALRRGGYEVAYEVVDTPTAMRAALERQDWDVITSDHVMPHFRAPAALALAKELRPDLPFIIVSGEIDFNLAVSLMKGGAQDYIQKRELARLVPAIERELREVEVRRERQRVEEALRVSETRYRRLFETAQDGILILDAATRKINDVNPFMEKLLGYSRDEFLAKELWEIGLLKDVEASQEAFRELQAKSYIRYENLPLRTKEGQIREVEFVSNVYVETAIKSFNATSATLPRARRPKRKSTSSMPNWNNAYGNALSNSKSSIKSWRLSTIRSPMICMLPCATSAASSKPCRKTTPTSSLPKACSSSGKLALPRNA